MNKVRFCILRRKPKRSKYQNITFVPTPVKNNKLTLIILLMHFTN